MVSATDARTARGSRQSSLEQSALRVEDALVTGHASFLFHLPQLPHLENGGWLREPGHGYWHSLPSGVHKGAGDRGAQATGPILLSGRGFSPASKDLMAPIPKLSSALRPWFPCGIGWALIRHQVGTVTSCDAVHLEGFMGDCTFYSVAVRAV